MLMGMALNWVAAGLLALANAFYVFVYTIWLTRRTPQNIVTGGAAGPFPPITGCAAVPRGVATHSLLLFALICVWPPPPFSPLATHPDGASPTARVTHLQGFGWAPASRAPHTVVLGVAAVGFLPLSGWAAVTGGVDLHSLLLFALIFVWTPPHFWALALYRDGDYAKARVPMLPVVAGRPATLRQIMAYSLLLAPLGVMPAVLGTAGVVYGAVAAAMGLCFILLAGVVLRSADGGGSDRAARQLIGFSVLYLFVLFTLLILDRAPGLLAPGFWEGSVLSGVGLAG